MKKLLLMIAFGATTISFGQYVQDFEGTAPGFVNRGAPTYSQAVDANPITTGINPSSKAWHITYISGVASFKWPGFFPVGYNLVNGKWVKIKFMLGAANTNKTSLTLQTEFWVDGVNTGLTTPIAAKTITGLTTNTWYEIEIDASGLASSTGNVTRLDLKLNMPASGNYPVGEEFWVDSITQSTGATLGSFGFAKIEALGIAPNPATNKVTIADENEDIKSVQIIDFTGKTVLTSDKTADINISTLEKGIYIIKSDTGKSGKLVKK